MSVNLLQRVRSSKLFCKEDGQEDQLCFANDDLDHLNGPACCLLNNPTLFNDYDDNDEEEKK